MQIALHLQIQITKNEHTPTSDPLTQFFGYIEMNQSELENHAIDKDLAKAYFKQQERDYKL